MKINGPSRTSKVNGTSLVLIVILLLTVDLFVLTKAALMD